MKILIFCPYYPPHIGGLESHADEFNKYLSQRGVDITVFTPRLPKEAPELETKYNGVKIVRFPAFEIIANYPLPRFWSGKFWRLFVGLFKKNFDVVISRTRFFNTSLLALVFAKMRRIKWIHIEHGSDFVVLSSPLKTFLAKIYDHIFGRLIFKQSDLNISISQAVQKFILKFDSRTSPAIYRGLDFEEIEKIEPDHSIKENYPGKTILCFAGRLYKWKGVENSILAVKSLPDEIKKKLVFLIIGDGEDFDRLKKISAEDKSVVMLGKQSREKTISLLKISDIYLHASEPGGGLSTSLLEAMFCGLAAIATPHEGANEVIVDGKNGILIDSARPELFAEKIKTLLENEEKRKFLADQASISIKNNFDWKKSIDGYLGNLKKIQNK